MDDAERITATDIMVNISKQHAGTSHRMKKGGCYYKMWSKHGKEEGEPCAYFLAGFQRPLRYLNFFWSQARQYRSTSESAGTQPEW
jgi:hypothetical protein